MQFKKLTLNDVENLTPIFKAFQKWASYKMVSHVSHCFKTNLLYYTAK